MRGEFKTENRESASPRSLVAEARGNPEDSPVHSDKASSEESGQMSGTGPLRATRGIPRKPGSAAGVRVVSLKGLSDKILAHPKKTPRDTRKFYKRDFSANTQKRKWPVNGVEG